MKRHLIVTALFAASSSWTTAFAEPQPSSLIDSLGPPPIETVAFNDEGQALVEAEPLAPARLAEELVIEERDDEAGPMMRPQQPPAAPPVVGPIAEPIEEIEPLEPLQEAAPVEKAEQADAEQGELVRERFPDGKVKIERYVVQDAQQNYINHGPWKMWDAKGNVIAEGTYEHGKRHGEWVGWFFPGEVKMLQGLPYDKFAGPFVSQAQFRDGQLHGTWTIFDSKKRTVSEFQYDNDKRDGLWTWWYPNGNKMREMQYNQGEIDGELVEWKEDGELLGKDKYIQGRRLAMEEELFNDGTRKSAGMYLHAKQVPSGSDDWWSCDIAPFMTKGRDQKHGAWTSWHSNGQERMQGEYKFDVPLGTFTWWHANGQKALEGEYLNGTQDGPWTWWHENGLKSIQGHYTAGKASGKWIWWQESGKVAQRADYDKNERTAESGLEEPARLK